MNPGAGIRLVDLFAGLPLEPASPAARAQAVAVLASGVAHDSRAVAPGDLFVTWSGARHDGSLFAAQALDRGAVAVVAAGPPPAGAARLAERWWTTPDPRRLSGPLAARVYGHPERALTMIGVTGTNGKTTTVTLCARLLEEAGRPCGVLGTLGYRFRDREFAGERTTPEAADLFRMLAAMRDAGARAVAMEVSSHALAQGRVEGLRLDVAVFTNLTRDHLDYHRDLENYFVTKRRIFDLLDAGGRAVIHAGDAYGRRLLAERPGAISFGDGAMVRAPGARLDARGIRGRIIVPRGEFEFSSPLLGRFNLENLLGAVAVGEALGLPLDAIERAIAAQAPLDGRLEPVEAGQSFPVLVDYAHTDAALASVLESVRDFTGRDLIVVFGCGGDRDAGKRAPMGRVAGRLADLPIATSDNPRSEDPLAILRQVEEGLRASGNRDYRLVPDRREAIRRAVAIAAGQPERWAVLVAGKGHEREQIIGAERLPFSDREELEIALRATRLTA